MMTKGSAGQVVTFYSFKGGTGRTMALANVAWILAANGKRVLAVDWDLESPGLHRYYAPFVSRRDIETNRGTIGLIQDFQQAKAKQKRPDDPGPDLAAHADLTNRVITLDWPAFPAGGGLDLLPAGKLSKDYATILAGVNWDDFYERQDGGRFFDALRATMKDQYDYVLIDSRTGYSDVADICTIQMPDVVVDCFTLNEQGIDGAANVARLIAEHDDQIRILPVAMRVDPAEKVRSDAGRAVAKHRFADIPAFATVAERDAYWSRVYVPYQAFYGYEEVLATFGDLPDTPGTMLAAYLVLTGQLTGGTITSMPPIDEAMRRHVNAQFERRLVVAESAIVLRYADVDAVWAEWITQILTAAGVRVVDPAVQDSPDTSGARDLVILSSRSVLDASGPLPLLGAQRNALAVYVADIGPSHRVSRRNSITIAGLPEAAAVEALLRLVGHAEGAFDPKAFSNGPRFPGNESLVSNLEARNTRFTGREENLRKLRRHLHATGHVVLSGAPKPVALQGMGGIGKTQIALEYAHRFSGAYDIVWWITAEPVTFIDVQLADLGRRLGIPMTGAALENATTVLAALSHGNQHGRWLLIFDNVENAERVATFVPSGPGHVLVTSRASVLEGARTEQVDVFERVESIAHFQSRVEAIASEEAHRLADLLGDLPIAVAAAAAFLAETKFPVASLVREIQERGPHTIPLPAQATGQLPSGDAQQAQSVRVVWDVSLDRLKERSAAAYRLLQLCSLMDTAVSLDLIYSDELAAVLVPYDPRLSERIFRGRLVQEISRLALARVEPRSERSTGEGSSGRISVHRMVQAVVRDQMSADELDEARHHVHLVLASARPGGEVEDPNTWAQFRTLWPHLEISKAVNCGNEAVRQLLIDRVRYLWIAGDYERGLERARATEEVWLERLTTLAARGEEARQDRLTLQRQLLHLRFNMANLLRSTGKFRDSLTIDEAVLTEQRQLLGDDHPLTLNTAGSLAGDLRGLGHYKDALAQDRVTYAAWQDLFGEENPRTLAALNNLATSYRLMGDHQQALALDELAARGRQNTLGERHPNTLLSLGHIGRDLREAGDYARSVQHLRAVARAYAAELSQDARDTLNADVNLAISLRSAGESEEAADLFDRAYERLSDKFPSVPDTLACRLSRAITLLELGDEQAESELLEVRSQFQKELGERHPHTLVCLNNLAMAALRRGSPQEGRDMAENAARYFAEAVGVDHPYTLAAETNLAVCTAECGRPEQALEILTRTAERAKLVLGDAHPDTLLCLANLALVKSKAGAADSDAVMDAARALAERIGDMHPAVRTVGENRFLHRVIDPLPF